MVKQELAKYLQMALNIQFGATFDLTAVYIILNSYEKVKELGGEFSLRDAAVIHVQSKNEVGEDEINEEIKK
jgi:hypothetical protein